MATIKSKPLFLQLEEVIQIYNDWIRFPAQFVLHFVHSYA